MDKSKSKSNIRLKIMQKYATQEIRFAVCVNDSEPDLEPRKIYKILPDEHAAKDNYLRVVDESGEDYLYPANYFVFVEIPVAAERALLLES